ncbi:hypothetical protein RFI_29009 [Reticulomyxa filosa]|uniref:Uncharacterized protein n=1 Tax=Reticulomyxa filosa TaxID=46433 RepID=X6M346_RETFI|nr:hypothetical protein RFI_29009 [Reticulomyxa filosa]|eukprot:ETO08378.1 hypothetical protein RFI_29009 [Reticulomyxa filosa]
MFCSFYRNIQKIAARYHELILFLQLYALIWEHLKMKSKKQDRFYYIEFKSIGHTYEKDGKKSSIDNNWRTDNDELDVHSDHLPIAFNIKASWSEIKKQKIEKWNS